MAELVDAALLLRRIPYGDTSLICHFLTERHGRIALMARGARRNKSSLRAGLSPLRLLSITWRAGRSGMGTLLDVDCAEPLLDEAGLLEGLELLAVAAGLFQEGDPHGFAETREALGMLASRKAPEGLLAASWLLLERAGWIGDLDHCWQCGNPGLETATMFWQQAQLVCAACGGGAEVSAGLRKGIRGVLAQPNVRLGARDAEQWRAMIGLILKSQGLRAPDTFRV
ncbi:MAG TPA: DNA repair protein RecO [Mariprofundaceae bacterium]|nr:DNA repair protein RecO [Mariprofundaceae bacterium]